MMKPLPFYGESANVINVQHNSKKKLDEDIVNQLMLKYNQLLLIYVVSILKQFVQ